MSHPGSRGEMKPLAVALLVAGLSLTACAGEEGGASKPPIVLESTGAYEVGGKVITNPADPRQRPIWKESVEVARTFCGIVNRHGGDCEVLRLPDVGLHGNSHIAFADLNNEAVANELSKWLHRKGLDKFAADQ